MYRIQIKLVSDELNHKLWTECNIIYKYTRDIKDRSSDKTIRLIMDVFIGIPCEGFRRLIKYLTFQEVLALIYEGNIEDAYKTALKYERNFMYMWENHELDRIKNGRLLTM